MTIKRPLPPPPRPPRAVSGVQATLPPEATTKTKGATLAIYQGLLSVFDEMTDAQRMEFVELAFVWSTLTSQERAAIIEIVNRFKG